MGTAAAMMGYKVLLVVMDLGAVLAGRAREQRMIAGSH